MRRARNVADRFRLAAVPPQGSAPVEPDGGYVLYELGGDTGYAVTEDGERITYDDPDEAP